MKITDKQIEVQIFILLILTALLSLVKCGEHLARIIINSRNGDYGEMLISIMWASCFGLLGLNNSWKAAELWRRWKK